MSVGNGKRPDLFSSKVAAELVCPFRQFLQMFLQANIQIISARVDVIFARAEKLLFCNYTF
jgi:hypothetical protein